MKVVLPFILLFLIVWSCKKRTTVTRAAPTCVCPDSSVKIDSSSMFGCWILTDTLAYSSINLDDSLWIPISTTPAVIKFNIDSSFCYDSNFAWSFSHYDRFEGQGDYRELVPQDSTGEGTFVMLAGNNELILVRHGIDSGIKERYRRQ
jgi:hypothetical protein